MKRQIWSIHCTRCRRQKMKRWFLIMDRFERQQNFSMTFGLILADRETMERQAKPRLKFPGGFVG